MPISNQLGVSFIGAVFGPLIGIFLLGMLTKFVNWKVSL